MECETLKNLQPIVLHCLFRVFVEGSSPLHGTATLYRITQLFEKSLRKQY